MAFVAFLVTWNKYDDDDDDDDFEPVSQSQSVDRKRAPGH